MNSYKKLKEEIHFIKDCSAGSNAITILCEVNNEKIFRKYAFEDSEKIKLKKQVNWINKYKDRIPLPKIINEIEDKNIYGYDMLYNKMNLSLDKYIESVPVKESIKLIEKITSTLEDKLYLQTMRKCDFDALKKYIDKKVYSNLQFIRNNNDILREICKYDYLVINGEKYPNIKKYDLILSSNKLFNTFKDDKCSSIHGDLTAENIIYNPENKEFYLIDPNVGNIHESYLLDYGKMMQSIHGQYECLKYVDDLVVDGNNIFFNLKNSEPYEKAHKEFESHLTEKFSNRDLKSIYYHEIIHWIRLLPYKIKRKNENTVVYYATLLKILWYVTKKFNDETLLG